MGKLSGIIEDFGIEPTGPLDATVGKTQQQPVKAGLLSGIIEEFGIARPEPVSRLPLGADVKKMVSELGRSAKIGMHSLVAGALHGIEALGIDLAQIPEITGDISLFEPVKPKKKEIKERVFFPETGENTFERIAREIGQQPGSVARKATGQVLGVIARMPGILADIEKVKAAKIKEQEDPVSFRTAPVTQTGRMVVQGALPSVVLSIGASLLTKNPLVGLAILGETTMGAEFDEQIEAGGSVRKALLISKLSGISEIATESLVFPKFIKGFNKGIPFGKAIELIFENAGQEASAGFIQGFLTVFGKETTKGTSIEDAIKIAFDAGIKEIGPSALVGAITAGLVDLSIGGAGIFREGDKTTYSRRDMVRRFGIKQQTTAVERQEMFDRDKAAFEAQKGVTDAERIRAEAEITGEEARVEAGEQEVPGLRVRDVAEDRVEAEAGEVETAESIFDQLDFGDEQFFVDGLLKKGKTKAEILDSVTGRKALDKRPDLRRNFARLQKDAEIKAETDPIAKIALLLNPESDQAEKSDILQGRTSTDATIRDVLQGKRVPANNIEDVIAEMRRRGLTEAADFLQQAAEATEPAVEPPSEAPAEVPVRRGRKRRVTAPAEPTAAVEAPKPPVAKVKKKGRKLVTEKAFKAALAEQALAQPPAEAKPVKRKGRKVTPEATIAKRIEAHKVDILPRKDEILAELDAAIAKAPRTSDEKLHFDIDGGINVFNTKEALTFVRKQVKALPKTTRIPAVPKKFKVLTPTEKGFGAENTVFTKEKFETAKQQEKTAKPLRGKRAKGMRKGSARVFTVQDLKRAAIFAGYYFEGGLRQFKQWSTQMIKTMGTPVKPHLEKLWAQAKQDVEVLEAKPAVEKPEGKVKTKSVIAKQMASDLANEGIQLDREYTEKSIDAEVEKAQTFVEKSPDEARTEAFKSSEDIGIDENAVRLAYMQRMRREGNFEEYAKIANHILAENTKAGQNIVINKGFIDDASPMKYIKQLVSAKRDAVGKKLGIGKKGSGTKKVADRIKKEVAKFKEKTDAVRMNLKNAQDFIESLRC